MVLWKSHKNGRTTTWCAVLRCERLDDQHSIDLLPALRLMPWRQSALGTINELQIVSHYTTLRFMFLRCELWMLVSRESRPTVWPKKVEPEATPKLAYVPTPEDQRTLAVESLSACAAQGAPTGAISQEAFFVALGCGLRKQLPSGAKVKILEWRYEPATCDDLLAFAISDSEGGFRGHIRENNIQGMADRHYNMAAVDFCAAEICRRYGKHLEASK